MPTKCLAGGGELMMVPGVEDCEKLAWQVQTSFQLPKRVNKLHEVENYHQAPPACHVFSRRTSCHCPTPSLLVRTFEKSNVKRQWHMPKPTTFG